jgi:hypothetical protein
MKDELIDFALLALLLGLIILAAASPVPPIHSLDVSPVRHFGSTCALRWS